MPQNPAQVAEVSTTVPQGASLEVLVQKETELSDQLANLQGERSTISRQLRNGSQEVRAETQAQVNQLDVQITRTTTALRSVRTQIATRIPPRVFRGLPGYQGFQERQTGLTGDHVAAIMVTFTLAVLMPISIGLTRRLWRRGATAAAAPKAEDIVSPRLERLEQAVDAVAIEIERISEGQRFVTRVMTERPPTVRPSSAPEGNEAAALGEAKPFLALGAGPMEPIPVAQRQAVRQSITPH
ncbi:MAG TPA: hypothetical protein VIP11_23985 [Gemmatimonadaceae bacterium]